MRLISLVRLAVPVIEQPIPGLIKEYIERQLKAARKRHRQLKQGKYDVDTIVKKVIKPRLERLKSIFRPGYVTQRGIKIEDMLSITRKDMAKQARRYKRGLLKATKVDSHLLVYLEHSAIYYDQRMRFQVLPFRGYPGIVNGVGPLGGRWLAGDETVLSIIPRKEIIQGRPADIVKSEFKPSFRRRFTGKVVRWGGQIVQTGYYPKTVQKGNDEINQLVSACARPGLVPVVNFIIENEQLFLEIRVSGMP